MSILNRPSDGLFNVLIALTKCLVSQGSLSRDKLLNLCIPKSVDPEQDMATKTLNRWVELGVLATEKGGLITIAEPFRKALSKKKYSLQQLVNSITLRVFDESNNENFWYSEENKSADFCRAQAWMLMQDVYSFRPKSWKEVEAFATQQGVEKPATSKQKCTPETPRVFGNGTRWNGFTSWSDFLGFGNTMFGEFSIDPTQAIRPHLCEIVPSKESLPIADFVDAIALKLPVLDGGVFRKLVEEKVNSSKWEAPKANELSTSFSRSLLRFSADGTIKLENKADARDKRVLLGKGSAQLETVSHIRAGENLS